MMVMHEGRLDGVRERERERGGRRPHVHGRLSVVMDLNRK